MGIKKTYLAVLRDIRGLQTTSLRGIHGLQITPLTTEPWRASKIRCTICHTVAGYS